MKLSLLGFLSDRNKSCRARLEWARCVSAAGPAGTLSLALLAACTGVPDWSAISQQATQVRTGCTTQHPESAVAAEHCANGSIRNLYASAGFPDMDVIDAYLAQREAIAERQDGRVISPQEARAEYAAAVAQENTLLQQRYASRAQITAATMPQICDRFDFQAMNCN